MILFDTETTGLVEPAATPLASQPRIIEFGAIKYDDADPTKELGRLEFLCNPGMALPEIITKITGLKDEDVKGQPRFAHFYPELVEFFMGEKYLIAHNVKFDVDLLRFDLMRIGKLINFPWPPSHICTVESSYGIKGHRLKLSQLYEMATGTPMKEAHRAIIDVEALHKAFLFLLDQGHIKL